MRVVDPVVLVFCATVLALAALWWHGGACDGFGDAATEAVRAAVYVRWLPVVKPSLPVTFKKKMGADGAHAERFVWKGLPFATQGGVVLQFQVKFAPGFEWGCGGGKLGGLFMGQSNASGGQHSAGGASARVKWQEGGGASAYVYLPAGVTLPDSAKPFQPAWERGKTLKTGNHLFRATFKDAFVSPDWHTVQLGLKPNTPNKSDGQLFFAVNGRWQLLHGFRWWQPVAGTVINRYITALDMDFFHGGPCSATRTSKLDCRDIKLGHWV